MKKKKEKFVEKGRIYIVATFNNTHITVTDKVGNPIVVGSCGMYGFSGTRKSTPYAAKITKNVRILKSKNKIARREGIDMGFKTPGSKSHASLLKKINIQPGQHGVSRRRKQSEQRKQLREKQKLRFLYGISNRQLKKYYNNAKVKKGNTSLLLIKYLEKRLDNVIYRLGLS